MKFLFGGRWSFHILFQNFLSSLAVECSAFSGWFRRSATQYAVFTEKHPFFVSFHLSLSWSYSSPILIRRISFIVDCWNVACSNGLFHCRVCWSIRSATFKFVSIPGLNWGGLFSHLWSLTSILCPSPTCHTVPAPTNSLASNKLLHTKEGLHPSSASINEQLWKYRALYTLTKRECPPWISLHAWLTWLY